MALEEVLLDFLRRYLQELSGNVGIDYFVAFERPTGRIKTRPQTKGQLIDVKRIMHGLRVPSVAGRMDLQQPFGNQERRGKRIRGCFSRVVRLGAERVALQDGLVIQAVLVPQVTMPQLMGSCEPLYRKASLGSHHD